MNHIVLRYLSFLDALFSPLNISEPSRMCCSDELQYCRHHQDSRWEGNIIHLIVDAQMYFLTVKTNIFGYILVGI